MSDGPLQRQIRAEPYHWPHDASFTPQNTALVIIDMQRDCKSEPIGCALASTESVTSLRGRRLPRCSRLRCESAASARCDQADSQATGCMEKV